MIIAPKSFYKFAIWFHQDVFHIHNTFEEAIYEAISTLDMKEYDEVRVFINTILNADYDEIEFIDLWNSTQSDILIDGSHKAQFRQFQDAFIKCKNSL